MTIMVCVDDNLGMMFHQRRQSRDIALCQHILNVTEGKTLYMNDYSAKLFSSEEREHIIVRDDFLDVATVDDYCFIENIDISNYQNNIDKIILYHWNRVYPSDNYFHFPIDPNLWTLEKTTDMTGNSHTIITEEVYVK